MNLKRTLALSHLLTGLLVSVMIIALLGTLRLLTPPIDTIGETLLHINAQSTQVANAVTSVVTYFRGLDTLGEVSILFLSIFGVALHMQHSTRNLFGAHDTLLQIGAQVLFPLIVLFGVYIITHGHLSPGGGFQGGVIIASAFVLRFLAYGDHYEPSARLLTLSESLSGAGLVLLGVLGLLLGDRIFAQILSLGTMGTLLSGGVIELVYLFVGLKVAAEMTLLSQHFIKARDV
ncbi:MAG: hypothetical protein JXK05_03150 [Campylobacterales bacterium]|nr:hypothetical protein [Campylobacterales bacterium]